MADVTDRIAGQAANGDIASAMINLLWAGARLDDVSDLRDMVDAIAVLDPGAEKARLVIAWWHVRTRAWGEALNELRRVEQDNALSSLGTALTAVCLYALGDPAWRTYAYAAAYRTDDPAATRTALALLAAPDVGHRAPAAPGEPRALTDS
jgi:type III secretion protein HrpB1